MFWRPAATDLCSATPCSTIRWRSLSLPGTMQACRLMLSPLAACRRTGGMHGTRNCVTTVRGLCLERNGTAMQARGWSGNGAIERSTRRLARIAGADLIAWNTTCARAWIRQSYVYLAHGKDPPATKLVRPHRSGLPRHVSRATGSGHARVQNPAFSRRSSKRKGPRSV